MYRILMSGIILNEVKKLQVFTFITSDIVLQTTDSHSKLDCCVGLCQI